GSLITKVSSNKNEDGHSPLVHKRRRSAARLESKRVGIVVSGEISEDTSEFGFVFGKVESNMKVALCNVGLYRKDKI
ncbi:387_t:CDS:2, partial [Acaulospora morrowiae]